jgi:hypothetical protein
MKRKEQRTKVVSVIATLAIFLFAFVSLISFRTEKLGDEVWKMLGITKQAGTEKIKNSFMNGYLDHYGLKNAKNVAMNDRAAIAKDLLAYTKQFIASPEFTKTYEKWRADAKPEMDKLKPVRTLEEIQKEEIAKTEKSIKDIEKSLKEMPDMTKALQPLLDMQKQSLKDYKANPKHEYFVNMRMGDEWDNKSKMDSYAERMKRWEKDYPVKANDFIAVRLEEMMESTADIDYNAQLVEKYGKKRFVNPKYEGKNTEWKQGFRAGKEVTEMSRSFVKEWLKEIKK